MQSPHTHPSPRLPPPAAVLQPSSLQAHQRATALPTQPPPLSSNKRSSDHLTTSPDAKHRNSSISSADSGYVTSPPVHVPFEPSSASYADARRLPTSPPAHSLATSPMARSSMITTGDTYVPAFQTSNYTNRFHSTPSQAQRPASPPRRRPGPFGPAPGRSSPQPRYPLPPPANRPACAPCRRKKVGCDLRHPTADYPPPCQRCQSDGEQCVFPPSTMSQTPGSTASPQTTPTTPSSIPFTGIAFQQQQQQQQVPSIRDRACPHCNLVCMADADLRNHLRSQCVEKHYVCETCDARFRRLNDLDRHKRIHTGERPHGCDICGRRFSRGTTLTRHRQGPEGCAGRRADLGRRRMSTAFNGAAPNGGDRTAESESSGATPPVNNINGPDGESKPSGVATAAQHVNGQRHAQAAPVAEGSAVRNITSAIDVSKEKETSMSVEYQRTNEGNHGMDMTDTEVNQYVASPALSQKEDGLPGPSQLPAKRAMSVSSGGKAAA